jgi:hypothetical protein
MDVTKPHLIYWSVLDMVAGSVPSDNTTEFEIFHKGLYDTIETWTTTSEAQTHTQWLKWKKRKFSGLQSIQTFGKVTHIMQVSDLHQYIDIMMQYPNISQQFHIIKSGTDKSIRYAVCSEQDHTRTDAQLVHLTQQFYHFSHCYEIKLIQLTMQLTDAKHTMINYDHFLKHHFSVYKGKIEKMVNDIVACTIAEVNKLIEQSMATLQGTVIQRVETFESNLNHIVDNIIT